jgi:DNA-binding NtrC family response regulator
MPAESRGAPPTVLVVDDDEQMRTVLRAYLEHEGYRVVERGSAEDAMAALDAVQPDVVILDRVMRGLSGSELLARLDRRHRAIPVILITAFGGPDVEAEALRRGAASYLEKPFRMSAVVQAIERLTIGRPPARARDDDPA